MNRKGFTLIELLATIVILSIVGGIATYGVINTINTSKTKSEKTFVDKLSNLIDDYIDLYPPTKKIGETYIFTKCSNDICSENYSVDANKIVKSDNNIITIKDLVDNGIVTYKDLVNPKNKLECFDTSNNPEIIVYKDTDFVYHYYVNLSNNKCDITDENEIINNIPDNLYDVVKDYLN